MHPGEIVMWLCVAGILAIAGRLAWVKWGPS